MHQGQVAGSSWNPAQYLRFGDHRLRPALELLARVPLESPKIVYDLGCGTGEITRIIADRWPQETVYGLDNSKEMLAKAASTPAPVQWIEADIREWRPDSAPDLLYSNATLHWLDNHESLFPSLLSMLREGGCLAVQMPLSWSAPSHQLMRETLANGGPDGKPIGPESLRLAVGRNWVAPAVEYHDLLAQRSSTVDIWETEYLQILEGDDPVLEWVKGTGLRPILNSLVDVDRSAFLEEYARRLRIAYPVRSNGTTLYPFRRLFMIATM